MSSQHDLTPSTLYRTRSTASGSQDENSLLDHIRVNHANYVKKVSTSSSSEDSQPHRCRQCGMTLLGASAWRDHVRSQHPLAEREINTNANVAGSNAKTTALQETEKGSNKAAPAATFLEPAPPTSSSPIVRLPRSEAAEEAAKALVSNSHHQLLKCPMCHYSSTQKSNLSRHYESFHVNYK